MMKVDLNKLVNDILTAPVYDVAIKTPLDRLPQLSSKLENEIYLKREDLQPVFSFKCRGAYNKLIKLVEENPNITGVVCASAGNHAQGVALSANKLGVHAVIVMPVITPAIKVNAVKRFGGGFCEVVLVGENFDEAATHAKALCQDKGYIFVPPFDDLSVIAGQGTAGKEIIEQNRHVDAIFVPVGGGGLLAGIAAYVKTVKPSIKVIGVEHVESASMDFSFQHGEVTELNHVGVFADGVAVKRVGDVTFAICHGLVDETIQVTTDEICAGINNIFDETRTIAEPSGAIALAGIKKWLVKNPIKNQTLVAINSGANVNFDRLRHITERTAIGAKTECLLGVTIAEAPGSFKKLCGLISSRSITEFNYRYTSDDKANIFIGLAIAQGDDEIQSVIQTLTDNDYSVYDLSDNDSAKLHVRYMVGGKAKTKKEQLYRFEFPERPGALLNFLNHMQGFNITLFHYRNHGSDYGRVLVGIEDNQAPDKLRQALDNLGYYYSDESENIAYQMFL